MRFFQKMLNRRHDERGAEALAMIIVIPVLVILVLTLIDVGMMLRTRMVVENIARDSVRNAAADGGNRNPRTNTIGQGWDQRAYSQLYSNGRCVPSRCLEGHRPSVDCDLITPAANPGAEPNTNRPVAERSGDLITCRIRYPYKAINKNLLDSPIGLGMGRLIKTFDIEVSARAETGCPNGCR